MKSYIIEINESDETIIMEVLHRFKVSVQPMLQRKSKKNLSITTKPKTVAHFLEISKQLSVWSDEDVKRIDEAHDQLNQFQPQAW